MLIDRFRYKETLKTLWHKVFGDSYSYIDLIFNSNCEDSILCFAELEGNEVVSAFYLLKSNLCYDGKNYNGYYLYAAATDEKQRNKGLMAKLIKEAQLYCKNNGYDFISLVPSEKSLYGYYGRFGFKNAMHCVSVSSTVSGKERIIAPDDYYSRRSQLCGNHIIFDEKAFLYASDCIRAVGYDFYSDCESILIKNRDGEIIERLSFDDFCPDTCDKYPFGMLYPITHELERAWEYTDIYMNIALD